MIKRFSVFRLQFLDISKTLFANMDKNHYFHIMKVHIKRV